ncbi:MULTISPECIES: hypothetical protein [unclassified Rhodococcus (in: high G+C Gram-positive bacteria)]|uniref:hypothetical protein n=1 Tax=unclassified Rhodococcus (in: high G+C Gram-positive bacteria) TaxID=192944 RepID=UPI00144749CC|nr:MULTISPECIES: hypothetical protein [unclassified Rhodococcus (in: high G+C Gram-positive bacteria)]
MTPTRMRESVAFAESVAGHALVYVDVLALGVQLAIMTVWSEFSDAVHGCRVRLGFR